MGFTVTKKWILPTAWERLQVHATPAEALMRSQSWPAPWSQPNTNGQEERLRDWTPHLCVLWPTPISPDQTLELLLPFFFSVVTMSQAIIHLGNVCRKKNAQVESILSAYPCPWHLALVSSLFPLPPLAFIILRPNQSLTHIQKFLPKRYRDGKCI